MNIQKKITFMFVLFLFLISFSGAQATIYKCVNTKEEVYYNDKPCPINNVESQIKAVKDPVGGYIPPEFMNQNSNEKSENKVGKNRVEINIKNASKEKKSSKTNSKLKEKESTLSSFSDDDKKSENSSTSVGSNKKTEIQEPVELIFH